MAGADASNILTIRLTPRSKIYLVMVVAPTDSFKTLITQGYFFLSTLFFFMAGLASCIAVLGAVKGVTMEEVGVRFFLTSSHSLNQTFLGATYSFSFLIHKRSIHLIDSLAGSLVG